MQSLTKESGTRGGNLEAGFLRLLEAERQRSERSGRPFVVIKLQPADRAADWDAQGTLLAEVSSALRETDLVAWAESQQVIAAICTETGASDPITAGEAITRRLSVALRGRMQLSFQVFPTTICDQGQMALEAVFAS